MTDKAVLFSIKPKYCELIISGEKTVEVRKTRPKIPTPFKGYIYCTLSGMNEFVRSIPLKQYYCEKWYERKGEVIGEFVCDAIFPIMIKYSDPNHRIALREFPYTCLTDKQIIDYLGNGKQGYGEHISNLVIYDKPKELSEFGLKRPPQSWCYVQEVK